MFQSSLKSLSNPSTPAEKYTLPAWKQLYPLTWSVTRWHYAGMIQKQEIYLIIVLRWSKSTCQETPHLSTKPPQHQHVPHNGSNTEGTQNSQGPQPPSPATNRSERPRNMAHRSSGSGVLEATKMMPLSSTPQTPGDLGEVCRAHVSGVYFVEIYWPTGWCGA